MTSEPTWLVAIKKETLEMRYCSMVCIVFASSSKPSPDKLLLLVVRSIVSRQKEQLHRRLWFVLQITLSSFYRNWRSKSFLVRLSNLATLIDAWVLFWRSQKEIQTIKAMITLYEHKNKWATFQYSYHNDLPCEDDIELKENTPGVWWFWLLNPHCTF